MRPVAESLASEDAGLVPRCECVGVLRCQVLGVEGLVYQAACELVQRRGRTCASMRVCRGSLVKS